MPVVALLAPWHGVPVTSFHTEWLAIICGLCAWLAALPVLWKQQQLFIPQIALLPLTLMAFIGVQAQLLPLVVIQHAQMAMLYLLWAAFLMVLVKLLVSQTSSHIVSQWIAIGLTAAAFVSSSLEFVLRLNNIADWWGGVAQPNNYANLLALGLVSVFYLFTTCKPRDRAYLLAVAVVIILGFSLTASRSVWLYWLIAISIAFLLQRDKVKWLAGGFVLYLALQLFWTIVPLSHTLQADTTAVEKVFHQISGSSLRLHIWQVAWQLFAASPWLGLGFGQFDWGYYQAGQHIQGIPNRLEHAHNLILHLLAELGVFPVLLLCACLFFLLRGFFAAFKQHQENNTLPVYAWLLMLVSIFGLHSLLEYPLWYANFLGVTAVIFSLIETKYWQIRIESVSAIAVSLLLFVGVGIASVHEWNYLKIERAFNGSGQKDVNQAFDEYREAARQAPLLAPYVATIFSIYGDMSDEKMRPVLTNLNSASYHFLPTGPMAYHQAELEALNGLTTQARQTMKVALEAYPRWTKNFIAELAALNPQEQRKIEFLRQMAEEHLQKTS